MRAALTVTMALLAAALAACGGSGDADVAPPVVALDPAEEPAPPAFVPLRAEDLPGFEPINFYHDIPGLLRDHPDATLSALGRVAQEPGAAEGHGFANPSTSQLLFVVEVGLASPEAATDLVRYLAALPPEDLFGFISPDETLFEAGALPPDGEVPAARASFRYGSTEAGLRVRDVASELLVFAVGRTVIFLLESRPAEEGEDAAAAGLNLADLARTLRERQNAPTRPSTLEPG